MYSGKTTFYPQGKGHGYTLVSRTLSSGKWHIMLWERKIIPLGKSARGDWNTTICTTETINLRLTEPWIVA